MATIQFVETQIQKLEGFRVKIRQGRDRPNVRSDRAGIRGYDYQRRLTDSKNVKDWRDGRFARLYPDFEVDVLKRDGSVAHGRTLLGNLRDA